MSGRNYHPNQERARPTGGGSAAVEERKDNDTDEGTEESITVRHDPEEEAVAGAFEGGADTIVLHETFDDDHSGDIDQLTSLCSESVNVSTRVREMSTELRNLRKRGREIEEEISTAMKRRRLTEFAYKSAAFSLESKLSVKR